MTAIEIKNDEKISSKYNPRKLDYTFPKKVLISIGDYKTLGFNNHFGNCKVCTIESLQVCLDTNFDKTIERLNELFQCVQKLCFFCTFNDLDCIENFKEHFKQIYCIKVPIGYSRGFQYHCLFMTNGEYKAKNTYIERIKKEGVKLIS